MEPSARLLTYSFLRVLDSFLCSENGIKHLRSNLPATQYFVRVYHQLQEIDRYNFQGHSNDRLSY